MKKIIALCTIIIVLASTLTHATKPPKKKRIAIARCTFIGENQYRWYKDDGRYSLPMLDKNGHNLKCKKEDVK